MTDKIWNLEESIRTYAFQRYNGHNLKRFLPMKDYLNGLYDRILCKKYTLYEQKQVIDTYADSILKTYT